jgi:integrase
MALTLQLQSPEIQRFLYSIKSKETQAKYIQNLNYFQQWNNDRKIEDLLLLNHKTLEELLIQYIIYMRQKNLSHGTINVRVAPIVSFLLINDVLINTRKLRKFTGENVKTVKDEAYTRQDLQNMFELSTLRNKLIIAIYSSTGIRKAALIDLKLGHLEKNEEHNLYKFTIYENAKEEYITFCTPECAKMIDEYFAQRKKAGEKITEESYLVRNDFNSLSPKRARIPKRVTATSLGCLFEGILEQTGLHEINHKTENYKYKRHKKARYHAFRKYFNTCLANCDVNVTIKERLMGHSVGLDDSYYRPTEKQLLTEYLKAVNELTINEENRLKKKVTELQVKYDKIDALVSRIDYLEKQLGSN